MRVNAVPSSLCLPPVQRLLSYGLGTKIPSSLLDFSASPPPLCLSASSLPPGRAERWWRWTALTVAAAAVFLLLLLLPPPPAWHGSLSSSLLTRPGQRRWCPGLRAAAVAFLLPAPSLSLLPAPFLFLPFLPHAAAQRADLSRRRRTARVGRRCVALALLRHGCARPCRSPRVRPALAPCAVASCSLSAPPQLHEQASPVCAGAGDLGRGFVPPVSVCSCAQRKP